MKAKNIGAIQRLKDIEILLGEHEHFYIYKITYAKELLNCADPKKLFGLNAILFIQWLLYRSKSLIEGSIHALNNNCALSSLLSVRAHFETTGSVAYFMKKLIGYYCGNIDFEKLDEELFRLSLGSTTLKNLEYTVPKPIQVLNGIDYTDEFLKKEKNYINRVPHGKMFREIYDELCDFCHPNHQGISMGSDIIERERAVIFYKTSKISGHEFAFFLYLNISATLFLHFYKEVLKLIKEKEIMPIMMNL